MASYTEHINYTAEDMLRYAEGRMPAAEMHALERAAMDDPFVMEALEGYMEAQQLKNRNAIDTQLQEVRRIGQPEQEKEEAKVIPLWRKKVWQYAVAATLVLGAGWLVYSLSNGSHKEPQLVVADNNLEQKQEPVPAYREQPAPATADSARAALESYPPVETHDAVSNGNPAAKPAKKSDQDINRFNTGESIRETETRQAEAKTAPLSEAEESVAERKAVKADDAPVLVSKEFAKSAMKTDTLQPDDTKFKRSNQAFAQLPAKQHGPYNAMNNNSQGYLYNNAPPAGSANLFTSPQATPVNKYEYRGKVVDANDEPLQFASVRAKGRASSVNTLTDKDGNFVLFLPDSMATVATTNPGFESGEYNLRSREVQNTLVMNRAANSDLKEVVVSDMLAKKNRSNSGLRSQRVIEETIPIDTTQAVPVTGWDEFVSYLENNNRLEKTIPGQKVELAFELDANGNPTNIVVTNSAGQKADDEAVRLLKDGPNWKNKKKKKAKAKVGIKL